ncbi:hypothetical protein AB0K00_36410 [Dactylosporangium sp. NPDC049525]|uniref:hypothetical protein n=1 Tax=Dactylosporangium sp. NPDC049525 TaxID=3154730 RepID=UPI003423FEAC
MNSVESTRRSRSRAWSKRQRSKRVLPRYVLPSGNRVRRNTQSTKWVCPWCPTLNFPNDVSVKSHRRNVPPYAPNVSNV